MRLNEYIGEGAMQKILFSGLFGGLGAMIGAFTYQKINNKKTPIKIIGLISITAFSAFLFIGIVKLSQPNYLTCEICGYKSLEKKKQECNICGNVTWKIEKKDNLYNSKQEWIKEEQLFWFGLEDSIQFFFPSQKGNFEKDKKWKPQITEADLASDTL